MHKTLYIINPAGNGGAGPRVWERFRKLWNEEIPEEDTIVTERPGHAIQIASESHEYDRIVAVGGDGTVNEVMEGVLQNPSNPLIGIIPAGTGNDIARHAGVRSVDNAIKSLVQSKKNLFDIMKVQYENKIKYAFLIASFGFSASHRIRPWMKRMFGPTLAYYLSTLLEIVLFRSWEMTVEWEGGNYKGKTNIIMVANVERSSGDSMVIGPGASPHDGKMTVTIVPFKSKYDCLVNKLPKLPTGQIGREPGVKVFKTDRVTVSSDPSTDMDIDGENLGITPATVEILPKRIGIISLID